jgi:putative transposase
VFHRDHGAQCPRMDFTRRVEVAGGRMSMDGRGRALDHVVVEPLWRTVTDAEVYLQDDATPREATLG